MSVTDETFQDAMSPLKDDAFSNMLFVLFTPERSGASVALYTMLPAPWKAFSMPVHCVSPHWSIETRLEATPASFRLMRSRPPDTDTVWLPASA